MEHSEELHREGSDEDPDTGELQRTAQYAPEADGGLRICRNINDGC